MDTIKIQSEIILVPISELHEYPGNAKAHSVEQIDLLARGIKQFSFTQPIVIDKNNEIVAGHGRYYAAVKLDLTEVPCIIVDDLTDAEVRAYRLADNRISEMTTFDMGLVIEEMRALDTEGFDVTLTGFNTDLLLLPDDKDDEVPTDAPVVAKTGDLWQLGAHRVLCGDSTDKDAVARLMGGCRPIWCLLILHTALTMMVVMLQKKGEKS